MGCPLLVGYSYKISFPGTAAYTPDVTFFVFLMDAAMPSPVFNIVSILFHRLFDEYYHITRIYQFLVKSLLSYYTSYINTHEVHFQG